MYIAQASGGITVTDEAAQDGPDGVEWIGGVWKYTVNDANIAPDNLQVRECLQVTDISYTIEFTLSTTLLGICRRHLLWMAC